MQVIKGVIPSAQKVVIYGPEGIGKSTFASYFPNPLFIDTEGSTKHMDVARLPKPGSWTMLMEEVRHVKSNPQICDTLFVDTADWAESLCIEHICAKHQVSGIEDFGYGKGYTYLEEEFGRFLNLLEEVVRLGVHVGITAHAQMRKFEQPDELGAYDRWELKLEKKTAALVKEWADIVLFANYKTHVVNVDNQGAQKGKNKAQGGKRIMYTSHHPCWDAKNRHGLDPELPFEFNSIAHCIPVRSSAPKQDPAPEVQSAPTSPPVSTAPPADQATPTELPKNDLPAAPAEEKPWPIPKALAELMVNNSVKYEEIQEVVSDKGYYPKGTPIENYDPDFVAGVLVAAWVQVFNMIQKKRLENNDNPF